MPEVDPGEQKFGTGNRIPFESQGGAGNAGDAVAIGADGGLVLTSDTNGFAGVLGATPSEAGERVPVNLGGVVRTKVAAAVTAGDRLVGTTTSGQLGAGGGTGDPLALTDADADGYALVRL